MGSADDARRVGAGHVQRRLGWLAFILFLGSIPLANWLIEHVGTVCVPAGPCLIPVAPGVMAPSGVVTVGAALVLRDIVQRCLGTALGLAAILAGALLSALMSPPALVFASASAFLLSEIADFAVYTPLQRRSLLWAVLLSSLGGLLIDSVVFLYLAFGGLEYLPGQILGKLWALLVAVPLVRVVRRIAPTPA
ncbi:MAG: VUT family protein [Acetobacteraceae bacterium]|nr:VUT family protein [Acetobacteraceae bacterium]